MRKIQTDFEDKVVLTSRVVRWKERFKKIFDLTTKLLQRKDIPSTAKDQIREIRREADKDDED